MKMMKLPLLDLKAQYRTRDEILLTLERVLEAQYFILGPEVTRLVKRVAEDKNP
jgi:hypothetical protein